ncbi:MAG: protein-glutamate O-methyltransferase CheR [Gemmatimonadales bacterium]|nr:protein-glutamate O-methyltransferase CheR [Gemmatimonadales bacterium]
MSREEEAFALLARDLSRRTGVALDAYKPKCLRRRIAVRMRAVGAHTFDDYRAHLDRAPDELQRLHDTLTINVTRFHRNPETWAALAPRLSGLAAHAGDIRCWSAGCASGEEPYTLAMLWAEAARGGDVPGVLERLHIEATDIDRASLARARAGRYPEAAFAESPPDVVARWTSRDGDARVVDARLRARVEVRPHDLTRDLVPVARYDLVTCRNAVIYFERPLQERLFAAFHDALRPGGLLVLGKVETLSGPARDRLELIDVRERIYRRPS